MYKVFVVDDIEVLRRDIKRMKVWGEESGFSIEGEASDGCEALRKIRESPYDLLITDIRMPLMNGIELLEIVSKEKLCPCIVLLSDYTEFSYAREGLVHGAFDYLGKPVNIGQIRDLLKRVKEFLDMRKLEQERIKQWEGMAEEAFFPTQQVEKIVSLMIKGRSSAKDAIYEMLDLVGAALGKEIKKSMVILENASESILNKLLEEHKWIELYMNIDEVRILNLSGNKSYEEVCQIVLSNYKNLLNFLQKFIVWNEDGIVKQACLNILNNIGENTTIKDLAENLYISKAYLSEVFRQGAGISLMSYISMVKMERAKHLLVSTTHKNYEIAESLGYNDHEYFSKVFKKNTGLSPTLYRKEYKEDDIIEEDE